MGLPLPPVPYLERRVIRPRSGKVLRPPPGSPAFFCDAFQGGSSEPLFRPASLFYVEAYGFSSGPNPEPPFDPVVQRVCSHWASCATRHLVSGGVLRGRSTCGSVGWIQRWRRAGGRSGRFSARLFPLPRGWLTPLDSSGGRMEYSAIPTAATALRFCARGHLLPLVAVGGCWWLLVAVHVVVRPLRLCRGATAECVRPRRSPPGRKPPDGLAMVSGWGALIAGCPACRLVWQFR